MAAKKPAAKPAPSEPTPDVTTTQAEVKDPTPTPDTPDMGLSALQAEADRVNAQGYDGQTPDENPNSAYTVPSHGKE